MLFSTRPQGIAIERMMTGVPNFPPRGHGVYVFNKFKYTAKDCDCRLCPHYDRKKKCKLPKCACIEERIEAGAAGYAELMSHTFEFVKNTAFKKRLKEFIKESENCPMMYRGNAHKEMFQSAIEKSLSSDNSTLSALYLLTADKHLWSLTRRAVGNKSIDFSAVRLGDVTPAADKLLCSIADTYVKRVGNRGICCRGNSDRFACLVEHYDGYTNDIFAEALTEINAATEVNNIVMKWGIYYIDRSDTLNVSIEQIIDRALLAAQNIKGQYENHFAVYDDALRSKMLYIQSITDSMETALVERQFEIYLQPKYRISDQALVGAEALVRWNHPKWGFLPPSEFIPLFEKNGFITKLDRYVWDMACEVLERWDAMGVLPIPISVNVSRADLHHSDIADILLDTVNRYGLSPRRLHLEITESAYTDSTELIIATVEHLRKLGFIISMDDFGSGYSSLNMLGRMPIDILKLDMKFLQGEMDRSASDSIMQFIITLARFLKLMVIAEGVETEEELNRLQEINCDCVQGYYFAKPMPVSDFEELMKTASIAMPFKNRGAAFA